jgi:hypothetical protein
MTAGALFPVRRHQPDLPQSGTAGLELTQADGIETVIISQQYTGGHGQQKSA